MQLDLGEVRGQLDRILASRTFSDAERARSFLRYVVETAIAGQASTIKESVIGVEVLGRAFLQTFYRWSVTCLGVDSMCEAVDRRNREPATLSASASLFFYGRKVYGPKIVSALMP
jgi:hypothetical protein